MAFFDKFKRKRRRVRDPIAEILNNIEVILKTKRGFGTLDERFGMTEPSTFLSPGDYMKVAQVEIKENIQLFEPRIEVLEIKEAPGPSAARLCLELDCVLLDKKQPIKFLIDMGSKDISLE